MLLGLAIEYVDAINEQEIPAIVSSFEWVAHAEAQWFADQMYEETVEELNQLIPESLMPMEESEITHLYQELEDKTHKKLCLKLYDKANIQVITETLTQFFAKLREILN